MKNKRKLKIIKYNLLLKDKLDIKIKDFKNLFLLKNINKEFNLQIEDIDVKKIDLIHNKRIYDSLKNINKIEFKNLEELDLTSNKISDINILQKLNFENLKILNLSYNYIQYINALKKVNFPNLKSLILRDNKISDINILEKLNFTYLEKLDLSYNKISDFNVLKKVNFKKLKILDY